MAQSDQFSIAALLQRTQTNSPYNWIGVLEFLHQQHKQMQLKESEWALEKSIMQSRVKELEGVMQGLEKVVTDLGRRCKMLEVALRQERIKHQRQQNGISGIDYVGQLLQENMDAQLNSLSTVPKRKARPYRPLLQKILQEVGIQQIFSPPGSPRADNTSNRPSVLNATPNQPGAHSNSGRQSPISRNPNSGFASTQQANSFSFLPNQKQRPNPNVNQTAPPAQQQSFIRVQNQETPEQKEPIIPKGQLANHFDGVRDAFFFQNVMATVSEDCQIRLWDPQQFDDQHQVQPYLSLREHTGPIFTVAGYEPNQQPYMIFSAGSEGIIKAWQVPEEAVMYGPSEVNQKCFASWTAHQDSIWQLRVNDGLLLSSGSDGLMKLWSLNNDIQHDPKPVMQYACKSQFGADVAAAVSWISYNNFVCGFLQNPIMQVYDVETGKVLQTLKYQSDQQNSQLNSILSHPMQSQLITACEDNKIRVFDLNSGRMVNQFAAHEDAVTGVALNLPCTLLYSGSHDGHLKAWDMRKFQQCFDQLIHNEKYDEAIHNIVHHPTQNILVTCGADSVVKLFNTRTS